MLAEQEIKSFGDLFALNEDKLMLEPSREQTPAGLSTSRTEIDVNMSQNAINQLENSPKRKSGE